MPFSCLERGNSLQHAARLHYAVVRVFDLIPHQPPCSSCFSRPIKAAAKTPERDRTAASTSGEITMAGKRREGHALAEQKRQGMLVVVSAALARATRWERGGVAAG